MNKFFEFLIAYRHELISLLIGVVVILVTVFKKKVKIHDTFEIVLLTLPDFINEAESLNLKGSDKFSYVFNKCVDLIKYLTHEKSEKIIDEYSSLINEAVENILTTPQKKER